MKKVTISIDQTEVDKMDKEVEKASKVAATQKAAAVEKFKAIDANQLANWLSDICLAFGPGRPVLMFVRKWVLKLFPKAQAKIDTLIGYIDVACNTTPTP